MREIYANLKPTRATAQDKNYPLQSNMDSTQSPTWPTLFSADLDQCGPYYGAVTTIEEAMELVREFSLATSTTYRVTRSAKAFGASEMDALGQSTSIIHCTIRILGGNGGLH